MGLGLSVLLARDLLRGFAAGAGARWPEHPGTTLLEDGSLEVDASCLGEGYFMARVNGQEEKRLKLRVEKEDLILTYDIGGGGEYASFPLQMGSGAYQVTLYENVGGKKYSQAGRIELEAELLSENGAYLYPNPYVDYTADSQVLETADSLCRELGEREAFQTVCDYMSSEFVYDFVRAITVSAGELPDLEGSYERRMGICQDLSAVMVAMLRSQGIPARLVIGYADTNYHAWTETMIGGDSLFFDPTAALDAIASPKDYSVERCY